MRWLPLLTIALMLPLAACATTRPATYLVETKGPYQLDTGDVVRVTVYGDAELTDTYRVDDGGAIAFPLVGPVQVRGMTTQDGGRQHRRRAGQRLHAQPRCRGRSGANTGRSSSRARSRMPASSPMSTA